MIEVVVAIFLIWIFRKVIVFMGLCILALLLLIEVTAIVYPATQNQPIYPPTQIPSQVIVRSELSLPIPSLKPLPTIYMVNGILATDELTPLGD